MYVLLTKISDSCVLGLACPATHTTPITSWLYPNSSLPKLVTSIAKSCQNWAFPRNLKINISTTAKAFLLKDLLLSFKCPQIKARSCVIHPLLCCTILFNFVNICFILVLCDWHLCCFSFHLAFISTCRATIVLLMEARLFYSWSHNHFTREGPIILHVGPGHFGTHELFAIGKV